MSGKTACLAGSWFLVICLSCSAGEVGQDISLPNPLNRAKVGQWVLYRIAGRALQRSSITDIDGQGNISIQTEQMENGNTKIISSGVVTVEQGEISKKSLVSGADSYSVTVENDGIVLGKAMTVVVLQVKKDGRNQTYTLSDEVPLFGEILIEDAALPFPVSELVDYQN